MVGSETITIQVGAGAGIHGALPPGTVNPCMLNVHPSDLVLDTTLQIQAITGLLQYPITLFYPYQGQWWPMPVSSRIGDYIDLTCSTSFLYDVF
jgi:hypothetical protein